MDDILSDSERILSPAERSDDNVNEVSLRPADFREFVGQKTVVENVDLMIKSANKRKQAMDHILFYGPPGLGKTSLAMLVARGLKSNLHVVSGPAIEKKGDLAAVLSNLQPRDVLFIDEIHRIHISVEEILYSAMEDFRLDILVGQGPAARTMQIKLRPFTLIGATTRSGLLSNPLRDRFMANLNFTLYGPSELSKIIEQNASKMNLSIKPEAMNVLAKRSRGTPRIALRILRRVRDYAVVHGIKEIEEGAILDSLKLLNIDSMGLDSMDNRILRTIKETFNGGPVGIEALSSTLGEDRGTIEDVYEPYLLKAGILIRTSRGRILSEKGESHLNSRD